MAMTDATFNSKAAFAFIAELKQKFFAKFTL
jgi:hypothetical protein